MVLDIVMKALVIVDNEILPRVPSLWVIDFAMYFVMLEKKSNISNSIF